MDTQPEQSNVGPRVYFDDFPTSEHPKGLWACTTFDPAEPDAVFDTFYGILWQEAVTKWTHGTVGGTQAARLIYPDQAFNITS